MRSVDASLAKPGIVGAMANRYRCGACGNLTRFDVVATLRTRSFHHFSIGGELSIEETEVLEETIEQVTCRWCGSVKSVEAIEPAGAAEPIDPVAPSEPEQPRDRQPEPQIAGSAAGSALSA